MDFTRRRLLGSVAAAGAVAAAGCADTVGAPDAAGLGDENGDGTDGEENGEEDGEDEPTEASSLYVDADPDAPFAATLDGPDGESSLFDAGDIDHVEGVYEDGDEYLVILDLDAGGRNRVRSGLDDAEVADDLAAYAITMTHDGEEVRRVDLDAATVEALTGDDWEGVITLPFAEESVARGVYDGIAAE